MQVFLLFNIRDEQRRQQQVTPNEFQYTPGLTPHKQQQQLEEHQQ